MFQGFNRKSGELRVLRPGESFKQLVADQIKFLLMEIALGSASTEIDSPQARVRQPKTCQYNIAQSSWLAHTYIPVPYT